MRQEGYQKIDNLLEKVFCSVRFAKGGHSNEPEHLVESELWPGKRQTYIRQVFTDSMPLLSMYTLRIYLS
jgi:hypothetical protein